MARPIAVDVAALVAQKLTQLGRVNMPIAEFLEQAELTERERQAFMLSLGQKSPFLYVDAYNYATPIAMVGTFQALTSGGD